jgi:hypothetical protein
MSSRSLLIVLALVVIACGAALAADSKMEAKTWNMNATIIEACSCPMFCQCYFDTKPAAHAGHEGHGEMEHYCRFNNAFKVNRGSYGGTKLDGSKFWVAGDLGAEFGDGEADWAVVHFDPSVTPAQREGIQAVLGHVYPIKWKSFAIGADAPIDWSYTKDVANAKLGGGSLAEVALKRNQGMSDQPIVIQNLRYFAVPRNTGFKLMQNEVEAYRTGDKPYEYKGTNGFMITFDINSRDVKPKS